MSSSSTVDQARDFNDPTKLETINRNSLMKRINLNDVDVLTIRKSRTTRNMVNFSIEDSTVLLLEAESFNQSTITSTTDVKTTTMSKMFQPRSLDEKNSARSTNILSARSMTNKKQKRFPTIPKWDASSSIAKTVVSEAAAEALCCVSQAMNTAFKEIKSALKIL